MIRGEPVRSMVFWERLSDQIDSFKISVRLNVDTDYAIKLINLQQYETCNCDDIKGVQEFIFDHEKQRIVIKTTNKDEYCLRKHMFLSYIGDARFRHYFLYLDSHLPIRYENPETGEKHMRYYHICVPVSNISISFVDPHFIITVDTLEYITRIDNE